MSSRWGACFWCCSLIEHARQSGKTAQPLAGAAWRMLREIGQMGAHCGDCGGGAVAAGAAASGAAGERSGSTTARASGEGLASGELSGAPVSAGFWAFLLLGLAATDADPDEDEDAVRFALRCRCAVDAEE